MARFMLKNKKKKLIGLSSALLATVLCTGTIHGTEFYLIGPEGDVKPGEPFTVTVVGNVAGRFDATVTGGTVDTNQIFIDSVGQGGTFTVTPTGTGQIYVGVVAKDATNASYETVEGSQGITVNVVKEEPKKETTTTPQQNQTQTEQKETPVVEEPEPYVEPEDKKTEEKEILVNVKDVNDDLKGITVTLDSANLLDGFEKTEISVKTADGKNEKVEAYKHLKSNMMLVNVKNGDDDYATYVYNPSKNYLEAEYKQIAILGHTYGVIDTYSTIEKFKEYLGDFSNNLQAADIKIDSMTFKGLEYKQAGFKNYKLLYLMDVNSAEFGIYQYEAESKTLQPYKVFTPEEVDELKLDLDWNAYNTREQIMIGGLGAAIILLLICFVKGRINASKRKKIKKERDMLKKTLDNYKDSLSDDENAIVVDEKTIEKTMTFNRENFDNQVVSNEECEEALIENIEPMEETLYVEACSCEKENAYEEKASANNIPQDELAEMILADAELKLGKAEKELKYEYTAEDLKEFKKNFLNLESELFENENVDIVKSVFASENEDERNVMVDRFIKRNRIIVFSVANQVYAKYDVLPINVLVEEGKKGYSDALGNLDTSNMENFVEDAIQHIASAIYAKLNEENNEE